MLRKIVWMIVVCFTLVSSQVPYALDNSTFYSSVPYAFFYSNIKQWDSIGYKMISTNSRYIVLYWSGIGGDTDIGKRFLNYMTEAQHQGKRVTLIINGPAISMHAAVVCYANEVSFSTRTYLLFHNVRSEFRGRDGVRAYYDNETRGWLNVCSKYVTSADANLIIGRHERMEYWSNGKKVFKPDWR